MQPCPQCGTMLAENQRFCSTCGYDMESVRGAGVQPTPPVIAYPTPAPNTPPQPPTFVPPQQPVNMPPPSPYEPLPPPPQVGYGPPNVVQQQPYPSQQPYPPQQPYPSQQIPPTRPPITPTPSQVLPDLFGPSMDPSVVLPTNSIQIAMKRNLPQFATNPIAGAIVGGIGAVLGCLVLTFVFAAIVGSALSSALSTGTSGFGGIFTNSFAGNIFNIVALEHRAELVLSTSVAGVSGSATVSLPILLLLVIPAVCLVIGGYIAAATDYTNQVRFVIGRAAAVGPVYGVLMALCMTLFGTQSLGGSLFGVSGTVSFGGSAFSMLLYGILWGTLFASLGGFIKFFGWRWRGGIVTILLNKQRMPIVAGAVGAGAAVGLGLLLMSGLVLLRYGDGFTATKLLTSIDGSASALSSANSTLGTLNVLMVLLALPLAIWAFAFASGGAFDTTTNSTATQTINLFDPHISHAVWLLMLIPIIAFFVGGRVAARLTGSNNQTIQAQAGALMGVLSGVIMALLAFVSGFDVGGSTRLLSNAATYSIGPNVISTFVATAIMGVIVGGIGGYLYHAPTPTAPRAATKDIFAPYDRLVQQQPGVARPIARTWLYVAVTSAGVMTLLAIFLDLFSGTLANSLHFNLLGTSSTSSIPVLGNTTGGVIALFGGLMLAVPMVLFVVSLAFDLFSLPADSAVLMSKVAMPTPVITAVPLSPPSMPYNYPSNPFTAPLTPPEQQ